MRCSFLNPLVSVLVASYNHEKYIKTTLDSVINQTYSNIELLIIDDGSIDHSCEIIESYIERLQNRFSKVIFIQQENLGICKTFNKGLKMSTGKYFCILPSDDIMMEEFIEKQVFKLEESDFACSYTNGYHNSNFFIEKRDYLKGTRFSQKFDFKEGNLKKFLLSNVFYLPSPSFVYKSEVLEQIGGFDESLSFEDVDLMLRISNQFNIGYIDEDLFIHRIHSNNSGRNIDIISNGIDSLLEKFVNRGYLKYTDEEILLLENHTFEIRKSLLDKRNKKYWFDIDKDEILRNSKNKKIVAWGTGNFAENFIHMFPEVKFEFIVDSNFEGEWNGYSVYPPRYLKSHKDIYVLILSIFVDEIGVELEKLGFKKGEDFE
jgi:glycosyltransferase involved in cell wall biosynthesis